MPDKTLEKIINQILQVIIPDKIILFGSRAKEQARPDSDYDLLIIKSDINNERKITQDLYEHLDVEASVDIIVKSQASIEKSRQRFFSIVKEALNEGKVVYERS